MVVKGHLSDILGYLARYSSPLTVVLTNADGIPMTAFQAYGY